MSRVFGRRRALSSRRILECLVFALVFSVLLASVVFDWHANVEDGRRPLSADFGEFYCAGATVNARGNPYLTIPFDACGGVRQAPPHTGHRGPAPIPGYDVAVFRGFAQLPFASAATLWLVLSALAALAGILATASVTGLPPIIVLIALANGLRLSLTYGQLSPILLASLAVAAYALTKRAYVAAGCAVSVALLEPHVGIPAALALVLWVPRSRTAIFAGAACLALVSLATLGIGENIEYIRSVLPSQVLAEVPANRQYSLASLLFAFGASERAAVLGAEIQYALTIVAGLAFARPLALKLGSPAAIPLVVAAFAVVGGPFIHAFQIGVIAVPAALLLAGRFRDPFAAIAVVLLAASWDGNGLWLSRPWTVARLESAAIVAALVVFALRQGALAFRSLAGAAALAVYLVVTTAILGASTHQIRQLDSPADYLRSNVAARDYSTVEWGLTLRTSTSNPSSEALLAKAPTWLGLLLLVFSVVRVARRQPDRAPAGEIDLRHAVSTSGP